MFTTILAIGIVLIQLCIVFLVVAILTKSPVVSFIARFTTPTLRTLFTISVLGSLIYENVFLYPPCLLCWYQRIAIFSIAILSFTANIQKSSLLRTQISIMGTLGGLVAIFHNIIDIFPTGIEACGVTGQSCIARYVYAFNYVTIPMMSLTVLVFGLLLVYIAKKYPQASTVQAA